MVAIVIGEGAFSIGNSTRRTVTARFTERCDAACTSNTVSFAALESPSRTYSKKLAPGGVICVEGDGSKTHGVEFSGPWKRPEEGASYTLPVGLKLVECW